MRAIFLISGTEWSAGARAFVLAARGLSARGHDAVVACLPGSPVQDAVARADVDVVALRPDTSGAAEAWHLRQILRARRPNAVFVHSQPDVLVASSAVRLGAGATTVVRRVAPFSWVHEGTAVRVASHMVATRMLFSTEPDHRAFVERRSRVRATVAPIGVDATEHARILAATPESLGAPEGARVIVCLNDRDQKGALAALRTLALLAPRNPDLHLVIMGNGPLEQLRFHGAALGVNRMVSYLGARTDELAVMKAAHAGWIAARGDSAAFAALDFMALGVPVIAERSPLTEHFVADAIGGILLEPRGADPTRTAASVAGFLGRSAQHAAMGNAARARLQRGFPLDAMIAGFENVMAGASDRHQLAS